MKVKELQAFLARSNPEYDVLVETPHRSSLHTIESLETFRRDDVCILHVTFDLQKNPALDYRP